MSRILDVSSVFDDEVESPSGLDENKIQTWNSQYFRGEPVVMVAQERSSLVKSSNNSHRDSEKPLSLPIRSLKSRVSDPELSNSIDGIEGDSDSENGSSQDLVDYSSSTSTEKIGASDTLKFEEKLKESVVLPSPVPWRSRSGRIELKDELGGVTPPLYSRSHSANETEFDKFESPSIRSPINWSARSNSSPSPSPKKLSPAPSISRTPSLSSELRSKNVEDLGKKKSNYNSSPPTPPPPPSVGSKPQPTRSNSNLIDNEFSLDKKDRRRKLKNEVKEDLPTGKDLGIDSSWLEMKTKHRTENSIGKSVRTIRSSDYGEETRKGRGKNEDGMEINARKGSFQSSIGIDIPTRHVQFTLSKDQKKKESVDKIIVESDDSDSGDDREHANGEVSTSASLDAEPDANEVDKKADEFIAKFREQIRLQRIESIKRTSGQRSNGNPQ